MFDDSNEILTSFGILTDCEDAFPNTNVYDNMSSDAIYSFYDAMGIILSDNGSRCAKFKKYSSTTNQSDDYFDDSLRNGTLKVVTGALGNTGTNDTMGKGVFLLPYEGKGACFGSHFAYTLPDTSRFVDNQLIRKKDLSSIRDFVAVRNYYRFKSDHTIPVRVTINDNLSGLFGFGGSFKLYGKEAIDNNNLIMSGVISNSSYTPGTRYSATYTLDTDWDVIAFNDGESFTDARGLVAALTLSNKIPVSSANVDTYITIYSDAGEATLFYSGGSGNSLYFSERSGSKIDITSISMIDIKIGLIQSFKKTLSWSNTIVARTLSGTTASTPASPFLGTPGTYFELSYSTFNLYAALTGNMRIYVVNNGKIQPMSRVDTTYTSTCSLSASTLTFNIHRDLPSGTYLFGIEYTGKSLDVKSYIYFYIKWTNPFDTLPAAGSTSGSLTYADNSTAKQIWLDLNNYSDTNSSGALNGGTSSVTINPWVLYGASNNIQAHSVSANSNSFNISKPRISTSIIQKGNNTPVKVNNSSVGAVGITTNTYRCTLLSNIGSLSAFLTALKSGFVVSFK